LKENSKTPQLEDHLQVNVEGGPVPWRKLSRFVGEWASHLEGNAIKRSEGPHIRERREEKEKREEFPPSASLAMKPGQTFSGGEPG